MTVIAWDGKTLAADKRVSFGTSIATTTKIHRVDGNLVGISGDTNQALLHLQWVRDGMDKTLYPPAKDDAFVSMLLILKSGEVHYYGRTAHPCVIEDRTFSIGSGSEYADAAMYLGKSSSEAVAVASALDSACGNGIDTLTLKE